MSNVTALRAAPATPVAIANMIAIASGKGGVGKTWLAISLSHALAECDRRTLLFDGDLGLANVDVQLGLAPDRDLGGVLAGRYTLERAAVEVPGSAFAVIAGRSGSGTLATLPANKLNDLSRGLRDLAAGYDSVVLDLGAGIERTVRHLALLAGCGLVVINDEPTSLTDAYAFIKLCLAQNPAADLRVVVNMAANKSEGERTYGTLRRACESFLKAAPPLLGTIPRDPKVKDAIRSQTSILTRHPNCEAAQAVMALAKRLVSAP